MKYTILCLIFYVFTLFPSGSQDLVYNDVKTCAQIKHGLDKMYNFEFDESEKIFLEIKKKYPTSPSYDFLMSMNGFLKVIYFNTYKEKSKENLNWLLLALEKTKKLEAKYPKNPEVIFFYMSIYSSITLYYSQQKETMKSINYAKKTYDYLRDGYTLKDTYHELYFSSGIYDFYRQQYPETHPNYRSFMWLFAEGNKAKGIKELEVAANSSIFTRIEAHSYLGLIRVKYLSLPRIALPHTEYLHINYPRNLNFLARHIEALLLSEKYDEAEKLLPGLGNSQRKMYEMAFYVFKGLWLEKKAKNLDLAMGHYAKAIQIAKLVEFPVNDFLGHAYIGIARIFKLKGDKEKAKLYFNKTLEKSHYTAIIKEAEANLK